MTDKRKLGLDLFEEIYGPDMARGLENYLESGAFGYRVAEWSNDFSFATVWAGDGIERKLRSCVVLGMMIALRQSDEIRYHTKMGLANGLTRREIEEILQTTVPYCGFPAANVAKASMIAAFKELDAAPSPAQDS